MRRIVVGVLWAGVLLFSVLSVSAFAGATMAWKESEKWIAAATYHAECGPGLPSEGSAGCNEIRGQVPEWPYDIPITDQDLLLTLSSTAHETGAQVASLAGLFLAVAALLLTAATFVHLREPLEPSERVTSMAPRSLNAGGDGPPSGARAVSGRRP